MVEKCIVEYDCDLKTSVCLKFSMADYGTSICEYTPVAAALQPLMDAITRGYTKCKFSVAYLIAKEVHGLH